MPESDDGSEDTLYDGDVAMGEQRAEDQILSGDICTCGIVHPLVNRTAMLRLDCLSAYIEERIIILKRKELGINHPDLTEDNIFKSQKFCNVRRDDDTHCRLLQSLFSTHSRWDHTFLYNIVMHTVVLITDFSHALGWLDMDQPGEMDRVNRIIEERLESRQPLTCRGLQDMPSPAKLIYAFRRNWVVAKNVWPHFSALYESIPPTEQSTLPTTQEVFQFLTTNEKDSKFLHIGPFRGLQATMNLVAIGTVHGDPFGELHFGPGAREGMRLLLCSRENTMQWDENDSEKQCEAKLAVLRQLNCLLQRHRTPTRIDTDGVVRRREELVRLGLSENRYVMRMWDLEHVLCEWQRYVKHLKKETIAFRKGNDVPTYSVWGKYLQEFDLFHYEPPKSRKTVETESEQKTRKRSIKSEQTEIKFKVTKPIPVIGERESYFLRKQVKKEANAETVECKTEETIETYVELSDNATHEKRRKRKVVEVIIDKRGWIYASDWSENGLARRSKRERWSVHNSFAGMED
ncbi:hypothetical protein BJ742DRAFT_780580 [Cladochytrium replicatum]|nr:hypothetical protein BJ742DRAFT_780580 [Cladochytrium replicatum]